MRSQKSPRRSLKEEFLYVKCPVIMEKLPTHSANIEGLQQLDRVNELLCKSLGLVVDERKPELLMFSQESLEQFSTSHMPEHPLVATPETLSTHLERIPIIEPDPILRPKGDADRKSTR